MKVLKFGGTSVGTVESVTAVRKVARALEEPAVIVVSALGGLTDRLIATARKAAAGDETYTEDFRAICRRHHDMVSHFFPDGEQRREVMAKINPLLDSLGDVFRGIALIKSLPEQTLDLAVSFGERLSSIIIAAVLGATHFDSLEIVKTEKWFNKNIADTVVTAENIRRTFGGFKGKIAVMGGFISTDRDNGQITNLGRGGSDYTAALVAAAMNASMLEIWTDVDGFMTTDPRIIPSAKVMSRMSFVESMELCSFGAKIIYPPTIYPVFHKNIPIRLLNTFNLSAPGTLITDSGDEDSSRPTVKGISSLSDTSLITVDGRGTSNVAQVNSRIFNAMAKKGIRVILVTMPEIEGHISFVVASREADDAMTALGEEFAPDIAGGDIENISVARELTTIAVVGENITCLPGITSRIIYTLRQAGIEPLATSSETSQTTVSFVVKTQDTKGALAALHTYFFE